MIAAITALATVAGIIITTTLVSNAHEGWWRNRPSGSACTTSPSPSPSAQAAAQADNTTSTTELVAHREVEADGSVHVHYVAPEQRDRDRNRDRNRNRPRCTPSPSTSPSASPTDETPDPTTDPGTGETPDPSESPAPSPTPTSGNVEIETGLTPPGGRDGNNNGLAVVTRDCNGGGNENLDLHRGFQDAAAQCVNTQMGAVPELQNNPSLLITEFPQTVGAGEAFTISVATRNIVRNRFLGAAAGGYYIESAFLNEQGLIQGHFHLGCVNIGDGLTPPTPDQLAAPAFFVAVEDGGGGPDPDTVDVQVPGLADPGLYRCSAWGGDASHRTPMMTLARMQTMADSVRIVVE